MKLLNESYRTDQEVEYLVEFVAPYCQSADQVLVQLTDHEDADHLTAGFTCRLREGRPIIVKLGLSHGLTYPHTTRHVPSLPAVRLSSWQEEFILVLAHELRHADQIANKSYRNSQRYEAEEDAERFGLLVLDAYHRFLSMAA